MSSCDHKGVPTVITLFSQRLTSWLVSLSPLGPTDKSPDLFPTTLSSPHNELLLVSHTCVSLSPLPLDLHICCPL